MPRPLQVDLACGAGSHSIAIRMSDIATTAKNARESLARGLSALQSDPSVPPHIVDLATPIAQAMSALHQIERSNGAQISPHAETALNNVRGALSQLQAQNQSHPAIAQAMEAVAGSLGLVHAITKLGQQAAAGGPAFAPTAPQPAYAQPAPQPAYGAPPQQPPYGPPPHQQPVQPVPVARDPFAPQAAPGRSPMAATSAAPGGSFPTSGRPPSPPAMDNTTTISADLGANSPTNFYKGLSGNDIIDHGGLFVSTYMIPKIGSPVRLRVSLPGGYEFEANAIVQWAREQGGDAPPGFGAKFTAITPEARQLVHRYVRNREPLFHDDL
jgi:hypothetical protein